MVNVTNRSYVAVWLTAFKLLFCHLNLYPKILCCDGAIIKGNIGAGEGNRTLVISLEGFCSTIELHPLKPNILKQKPIIWTIFNWWRGKDSNLRRRKSTDLQSVAFDRSATPPLKSLAREKEHKVFQPDNME